MAEKKELKVGNLPLKMSQNALFLGDPKQSDSTRHKVASDFGAVAMVRFPQEVCTIHTCFKNILMVSGKQRSGSMKT